ncbi:2-polyprenyl-6-methoxyphenol hydroxylase [Actinacidiphila alni]|uniref:2-polyprenyl-6-methoxyphenol hydroxylase n=1 Tax=Actinacidiphila alni TaxID=380248 RepID=A0A1I2IZW2_9ACTN|nr:FAD-dependent monooxygenase [Actinacidiphila alni]SFF47268.1 2-polyprenyl-6-methoxyphenol hydroxylase [Actinacidiphila alni]
MAEQERTVDHRSTGRAGRGGVPDGVLVVGAGPVGLVAACELARRGIAVRVVDAAAGPARGSRGKGVQPRTIEVFDDLGVAGRIVSSGRFRIPVRRYAGRDVLNTGGINADAHDPTPAVPYSRSMLVPQWRTEEVLRDRLGDWGVRVEGSTALVSLEQDADGVTVVLRTADGVEHEERAAYVVGADGASSTVRKQVGIGFLGETDETFRMLVGDLELEGLDRDFWHMWPTARGGLLALCPLEGTDAFQIQAALPAEAGKELPLDEIQQLVDERTDRADIIVRAVRWQSVWRSNVRMADRYRVGRVFIAGDAAHVHSPAGGLGMNTGVQDAYNLGWKLAHVLAGAPDGLLDSYEQERLPAAADVLGFSSRLIGRGLGEVVPREGQGKDTLQLGLGYPGSDLSSGAETAYASPGHRAPDSVCVAWEGVRVRLFDLFRGPHLTVLAFGRRSALVAAALTARYPDRLRRVVVGRPSDGHALADDPELVVDHLGDAHHDYGVDGDTLFVVRPDGYVGFRGTDPDVTEVEAYLTRLLPPR